MLWLNHVKRMVYCEGASLHIAKNETGAKKAITQIHD